MLKILVALLVFGMGVLMGYSIGRGKDQSVALRGCETIAFEIEHELRNCERVVNNVKDICVDECRKILNERR